MPVAPAWHVDPYRRKSSTGKIVTISLVSVLVVVGGLIGVLAVLGDGKNKSSSVADSGYDYPSSSSTTSPSYTETASATTRQTSSAPTTRSTPTSTRTTTTTSTPSGPKPVLKTKDNPLFAGENGTNTVTCNLPQWRSTPQAAEAFFTAAMPCMEAAWAPVLQRANLPFTRPKIVFPSGKRWESGCGVADSTKEDVAAFYCSPDVTIYMPFEGLQTGVNGNRIGNYLALFAHEYGHHVQAMSGSLKAAHNESYELGPDTAAGLEVQRRKELQAQCFGGMWFAAAWNGKGSITDAVVRDMLADGYTRGDDNNPKAPRNHGKRANYGAWQRHGYEKNRTYQCNTYLAPANSVS
ncbi:neutral zinc metallopeptidase [Kibdelosporangium phytohabitans]|uniref:neutral zinc metallopeptidase n=1 Tax=Kibdelosporangium phytohabitans TaxID=860235 RepID=UPI0012F811BF|nr:neutral zinc metallopeptidase [Kibdelosporangium phytohabitans]MBE1467983.1 putative metalloprotease [Kibdelosporangium phytohabitans]